MKTQPLTACKQYCLAAGATQGNIAYTQNVVPKIRLSSTLPQLITEQKDERIKRGVVKYYG